MDEAFVWNGLNLQYPQKIALIVGLIGLFMRMEKIGNGLFRYLAQRSFGIFFLHQFAIYMIAGTIGISAIKFDKPYAELALTTILVIAISCIIIAAIRRLLGDRSRYFIGA